MTQLIQIKILVPKGHFITRTSSLNDFFSKMSKSFDIEGERVFKVAFVILLKSQPLIKIINERSQLMCHNVKKKIHLPANFPT